MITIWSDLNMLTFKMTKYHGWVYRNKDTKTAMGFSSSMILSYEKFGDYILG